MPWLKRASNWTTTYKLLGWPLMPQRALWEREKRGKKCIDLESTEPKHSCCTRFCLWLRCASWQACWWSALSSLFLSVMSPALLWFSYLCPSSSSCSGHHPSFTQGIWKTESHLSLWLDEEAHSTMLAIPCQMMTERHGIALSCLGEIFPTDNAALTSPASKGSSEAAKPSCQTDFTAQQCMSMFRHISICAVTAKRWYENNYFSDNGPRVN